MRWRFGHERALCTEIQPLGTFSRERGYRLLLRMCSLRRSLLLTVDRQMTPLHSPTSSSGPASHPSAVGAGVLEGEVVQDPRAYIRDQRSRYRLVQELFQAPTPVTLYVIGAIVLVYLWCLFVDYRLLGSLSVDPRESIFFGANWAAPIREEQEWWRLLSSVFFHGGWLHILFNGYAIYVLAPTVERLSGSARLFIILIVSGIGGSLASFLWSDMPSVGISGAVFGLVGALLGMTRKFGSYLPDKMAVSIRRGMIQIAVINLVIGFVIPVIDNAAHIGGFVAGLAVSLLMNSRLNETPLALKRAQALALALAGLAAWSLVMTFGEWRECGQSQAGYSLCYEEYMTAQPAAADGGTPAALPE